MSCLVCVGASLLGGPGEPARLVVQPREVLFDDTTPRELILVTVRDRGGAPVKWTSVLFESDDPSHAYFPFPEALTNEEGVAANVIVRVAEPVTSVQTSFRVVSEDVGVGPFAVGGQAAIRDGWHGFSAPGLLPFDGPRQRLSGVITPAFIPLPLGENLPAWSIDPTIAEPGVGTIISEFPNLLEFDVTARAKGETTFIIGTTDLALYSANVTGNLGPGECPITCPFGLSCIAEPGQLVQGVECVLFQADSGGEFILSNLGDFSVDDRVFVTGCVDPTCPSFCQQGDACIAGNTIVPHETLTFLRGDCNDDGNVEGQVTDAVFLLNHNFLGGPEPACLAACDANGDGDVLGAVTDAVYLLTFNFLGGPSPVDPFPDCGTSDLETDRELGCETPQRNCPQ